MSFFEALGIVLGIVLVLVILLLLLAAWWIPKQKYESLKNWVNNLDNTLQVTRDEVRDLREKLERKDGAA